MYDELIKRLREATGWKNASVHYSLMKQAADVIEAINRRETPMKITEIHVDEYFCPACGAENNCDQGHVQDSFCPVCGQCLSKEE